MSEKEGSEEKSFFRQILPSVTASLVIAMVTGFVTFVGTFSKIDTNNNVLERRVRSLEDDSKENAKTMHDLQLAIARIQVVVDALQDEVKEEKVRHQQLQQNLSRQSYQTTQPPQNTSQYMPQGSKS